MGETPEKREGLHPAVDRVLRIVIVAALIAMMLGAVRWRMLAGRLRRGLRFYENYQYEDAIEQLAPLMRRPLAALKLRKQARGTLLLCRAHVAAEERTLQGYDEALAYLEKARAAGAPAGEVDPFVKVYTREKAKLEALRKAPPRPPEDAGSPEDQPAT